jgi:hypothetical protein
VIPIWDGGKKLKRCKLAQKKKSSILKHWPALEEKEWAGSVKITFKISPKTRDSNLIYRGSKLKRCIFKHKKKNFHYMTDPKKWTMQISPKNMKFYFFTAAKNGRCKL